MTTKQRITTVFFNAISALLLAAQPILAMAPPPDPNAPQPPAWAKYGPLLFFGIVFWFLLLRPQSKQRKERDNFVKSLKKGDRVVTQGGIIGTILQVTTNVILLKVSDETKIEFQKSAIVGHWKEEEAKEPAVVSSGS